MTESKKKLVGFMGTPGKVSGSAFMETPELLRRVGDNTGNLVFQYAVWRSIQDRKVSIGCDIPWSPSLVKEICRILVLPASNFIRESFDATPLVSFLEQTDLPLVILGLGSQEDSFDQSFSAYHPSLLRLLSIIRERCTTVSVRGSSTASLLERLGLKSLVITGCPSNFINPDARLGSKLAEKWREDTRFLLTNGDEPWPENREKLLVERKILKWTVRMQGTYVQQSVEPFIQLLRSNNPNQSSPFEESVLKSLREAIAPSEKTAAFNRFLVSSVRVYYDVDQWLEDAARFDFSLGPRLHGNMVALQSGCPALWICHDIRTLELAETMGLPHISVKDFLVSKKLHDAKNRASPDFDAYDRIRARLYSEYAAIMRENDINLSGPFEG